MSELMSKEDAAEARIWRMTTVRYKIDRAMNELLEYLVLWPEEAKRLDVFGVEQKMTRIREATKKP